MSIPTWVVPLMHLLMGGIDQLCHQHDKLLKAQLLVLVCVQVLHDVIYDFVAPFLLLWVKQRRLLGLSVPREEDLEHSDGLRAKCKGKPGPWR